MATSDSGELPDKDILEEIPEDTDLPITDNMGGEIGDNDIVFDCPSCGHGLVINYRGAGLVINCTECGMPVQVPIPDGMELADLDQEPAELQNQIRNLRRALYKAEEHGREIGNFVNLRRLTEIRSAFEHVQALAGEMSAACARVMELTQSETR